MTPNEKAASPVQADHLGETAFQNQDHCTPHSPSAQLRPTPPKVIPVNIPEAIKERPQWVCWKYVWVEGKEGKEGRWTKPPYQPNGYKASKINPRHYSEFAKALAAYEDEKGGFDGIGFVLTAEDPFVAIDIDHCFVEGIITEKAAGIIKALDSYTEKSPSGEGIRIFVKGVIPENVHKEIEIYSKKSYVTVTGQRWQP